jgi:hypothetical protein
MTMSCVRKPIRRDEVLTSLNSKSDLGRKLRLNGDAMYADLISTYLHLFPPTYY